MKTPSVSPELWDTMTPHLLHWAAWHTPKRLGYEPIWYTLSRRQLHDFSTTALGNLLQAGHWEIIPHHLDSCPSSESLPIFPIILVKKVFDRHYWVVLDEGLIRVWQLVRWVYLLRPLGDLTSRSYFPDLKNWEAVKSMPMTSSWVYQLSWSHSSAILGLLYSPGTNLPSPPTLAASFPYFFLMIFFRLW